MKHASAPLRSFLEMRIFVVLELRCQNIGRPSYLCFHKFSQGFLLMTQCENYFAMPYAPVHASTLNRKLWSLYKGFMYLFEKQSGWKKERPSIYLFSANSYNSQIWSRLKTGARNSILVLQPSSSGFPRAQAGDWIRSRAKGLTSTLLYGMSTLQAMGYPTIPQCWSQKIPLSLSYKVKIILLHK